jgi:hypothetical protein
VVVPAGPPAKAEEAFLTALRAAGTSGYRPVIICAAHEDTPERARERFAELCDVVAGWRESSGGGTALEQLLQSRLGSYGAVLAMRWVLRAASACQAAGPLDAELTGALETATAGSHETAELDLLQALQTRHLMLPRAQADAERILGADGLGVPARLGLASDATTDEVAQAAGEALAFWRTQSLAPDTGRRRGAYAQLVRTCEWLLTNRLRP